MRQEFFKSLFRLALIFWLVVFVGAASASGLSSSNSSTDVFPGKRWKVIERCGKEKWEGIWKREDQTNIFKARWNYYIDEVLQPKEFEDLIELKSFDSQKVILYRYGLKGYYEGKVSQNKKDVDILGGDASWYGKGCYWTAEIEY